MIKQYLLIGLLTIGVIASVLLIQNSTALKSKAYDLIDFIPSFHSSESDSNFNGNLDVYKDGIINAFDIIKDRYLQQSSSSAAASASAEATVSAQPTILPEISPTPIITPTPTPQSATGADEYQRMLNSSQTQGDYQRY